MCPPTWRGTTEKWRGTSNNFAVCVPPLLNCFRRHCSWYIRQWDRKPRGLFDNAAHSRSPSTAPTPTLSVHPSNGQPAFRRPASHERRYGNDTRRKFIGRPRLLWQRGKLALQASAPTTSPLQKDAAGSPSTASGASLVSTSRPRRKFT